MPPPKDGPEFLVAVPLPHGFDMFGDMGKRCIVRVRRPVSLVERPKSTIHLPEGTPGLHPFR